MLTRRTDLADEAHALWRASAGEESALPGVRAREDRREGFPVTRVDILDREGAQALGKPEGHYITLGLEELLRREEDAFPRAVRALAGELNELLKDLPPRRPHSGHPASDPQRTRAFCRLPPGVRPGPRGVGLHRH